MPSQVICASLLVSALRIFLFPSLINEEDGHFILKKLNMRRVKFLCLDGHMNSFSFGKISAIILMLPRGVMNYLLMLAD